jgi:autotransporter-associated beta strand protein
MAGALIAPRGRARRQRAFSRAVTFTAAAAASCAAARAGDTWDGGGADNNWSTSNNWNPNGVPTSAATTNLTFAGSTRLTPNLDSNFTVSSITFSAPTSVAFTLGSANASVLTLGPSGGITTVASNNKQTITHGVRLSGAASTFNVANGNAAIDLEIAAVLSENAAGQGFVKTGAGTLKLGGTVRNSYTGAVVVNQGVLQLGNTDTSDDSSIRGNLTIGDGVGGALADVVRHLASAQIVEVPSQNTTINSSGLLDLNGFNESVGNLVINGGGRADANGGLLQVAGNATVNAGTMDSGVNGSLQVFGNLAINAGGTVNVASGALLDTQDVSVAAGGTLAVADTLNAGISGNLTITAGSIVTVAANGELQMFGGDLVTSAAATSATITGAGLLGVFSGSVVVADGAAAIDLDLSTGIDGTLTKRGAGSVRVTGPGDAFFSAELYAGTLLVGSSTTLGAAQLNFYGGTLAPDGASRSLTNEISAGDLTFGAAPAIFETPTGLNLTLSGAITGPGGVTKRGPALLVLSGNNDYAGNTTISAGTLTVASNSNLGGATGSIVLDGGTLRPSAAIVAPARNVILNAAGGTIDTHGFNSTLGTMDGTGAVTKSGAGTLKVNRVRAASLNVSAGNVAIAPAGGAAASTSRIATTITIAASSKLDLADGKLIAAAPSGVIGTWNGSSYTGLTGLIARGYHGGAWDGAGGILTTLPAAASGRTALGIANAGQAGYGGGTFGGVSVAAGDVLVMYTYAGDANLDGRITGDDYSAIDFSILVPGSNGWYNGDFNYSGSITGDDYSTIDFNLLAQGAPFPTAGSVASASGVSTVPEPATLALAILATPLLARRRRFNL